MKLHNLHYIIFQLWLSLILMCHLSSSRTSINFSEDTIFHKAERKIKRHSFSRKKERKLLRVCCYQSFSNKVLWRALFMKENLRFGLVWTGWTAQSSLIYPRTSDYRWTEQKEFDFLGLDLMQDTLGISKVIKISLPNLNDIDFIS